MRASELNLVIMEPKPKHHVVGSSSQSYPQMFRIDHGWAIQNFLELKTLIEVKYRFESVKLCASFIGLPYLRSYRTVLHVFFPLCVVHIVLSLSEA